MEVLKSSFSVVIKLRKNISVEKGLEKKFKSEKKFIIPWLDLWTDWQELSNFYWICTNFYYFGFYSSTVPKFQTFDRFIPLILKSFFSATKISHFQFVSIYFSVWKTLLLLSCHHFIRLIPTQNEILIINCGVVFFDDFVRCVCFDLSRQL